MPEKKKRDAPLSLRLSREDRARLERDAAGMSLGAYIKWRLFDPDRPPPRTRNKAPVRDHAMLSQALGLLGGSRVPANLNQLAKASNSGSLILDPELRAKLFEACKAVCDMRDMLARALGLKGDAP